MIEADRRPTSKPELLFSFRPFLVEFEHLILQAPTESRHHQTIQGQKEDQFQG